MSEEIQSRNDLPENPGMTYSPETRMLDKSVSEAGMERRFESTERPLNPSLWRIGHKAPSTVQEAGQAAAKADQPLVETKAAPPPDPNRFPDESGATRILLDQLPGAPPKDGTAESSAAVDDDAPVAMYELIRIVGMGGFGEVWLARQGSLGRLVAIKRIRQEMRHRRYEGDRSPKMAELLFRQEAATAALLEHPNIVPVHDLGIDEQGSPMLAMKFVRGTPWDKVIQADFDTLPVGEFLAKHIRILIDMSQAVAFAHSRGIIHRDLKPSQVMIGEFGEVLLMDWGLAIHVGSPEEDQSASGSADLKEQAVHDEILAMLPTLDSATNPAGTPALMAPEQTAIDNSKLGLWTDIYLLGGTLYYLLTGTFPHMAADSIAAMKEAARGRVIPPSVRTPEREVPGDLQDLCMEAMRKEPEHRIKSARAFIRRLEQFLSGSSRQRESTAITEKVTSNLKESDLTYHQLQDNLNLLSRAGSLWHENPAVPNLTDQVCERFGRVALQSRDLKLARFQAERIRLPAMRDELLKAVTDAEREERKTARQRSLFLAGTMILLIVVVIVSFLNNFRLSAERRERNLIAQRQRALGEDVDAQAREITSLIALADLNNIGLSITRLAREAPAKIAATWAPEYVAGVRVTLDGRAYTSRTFAETSIRLAETIRIGDADRGRVEVFFAETYKPGADAADLLRSATVLLSGAIELEELRTRLRSR